MKFLLVFLCLLNVALSKDNGNLSRLIDTIKIEYSTFAGTYIYITDSLDYLENVSYFQGSVLINKVFCRKGLSAYRSRSNDYPVFYEDRFCNNFKKSIYNNFSDTLFELTIFKDINGPRYEWFENGNIKRTFSLIENDTTKMRMFELNIFGDTLGYISFKLIENNKGFCWQRDGLEYLFDFFNNIIRFRYYDSDILIKEQIFKNEVLIGEINY